MTHFQLLASKLSDNELSELRTALADEGYERIKRRIGSMPELLYEEKILAHKERFQAMRLYRERTLVPLTEAKVVIETFLEKHNDTGLTPYEKTLVNGNEKIAAMRSFRERTFKDLEAAKKAVNDYLMKTSLHEIELTQTEKDLIKQGAKIQTIKAVKERLDCGLVVAKSIVESYMRNNRPELNDNERETARIDARQTATMLMDRTCVSLNDAQQIVADYLEGVKA